MRLEREHNFAMDQRFCHSKLRDRPRELDCICQHRNSVENGRDINWDLEFHHYPARSVCLFVLGITAQFLGPRRHWHHYRHGEQRCVQPTSID